MRPSTTGLALLALLAPLTTSSHLRPHPHGPERVVVEAVAAPVEIPVAPALYTPPAVPPAPVLTPQQRRDRASVSGRAMPAGNLPGWKQFLADDFRGAALPTSWGSYDGQPGNNPGGRWSSGQVTVHRGLLSLNGSWQNGRYTTGGVMSSGSKTTYGKFMVRFRVPKAVGVKYALLLWPKGTWPAAGEIDFAEDGDGARQGVASTVHYGWDNAQVQRNRAADFTQWQTVGVEWTPGKIVYTLNGAPWATVTGNSVPTGPMTLAMQVEAGTGDRWSHLPDARTPAHMALDVDWVVGYRPA